MDAVFKLRFPKSQIAHWAGRYSYRNNDDENLEGRLVSEISPRTKTQGFLHRRDFLDICRWKTQRTQKRCETNDDHFIRVVTSASLSSEHERLRIEVLTLLSGVGWPTASVILHFCGPERYPILDFRALWSLSVEVANAYDFNFWWKYTQFCRRLSEESGAAMRTLDRALWQFSSVNQPTASEG